MYDDDDDPIPAGPKPPRPSDPSEAIFRWIGLFAGLGVCAFMTSLRMMLMALGGSQLHPVLGKHVGLGGEQDAQAGARVEDGYQDVSA